MAKYRKCDIMQAIAIARADFREANEDKTGDAITMIYIDFFEDGDIQIDGFGMGLLYTFGFHVEENGKTDEEVFETLRDEMKREGEIEGNEMEIIY